MEIFNPVHRYINRLYFNYRDHRKITVIDGYVAYTGGINIGDEYANRIERFGYWKDSTVRLDGGRGLGLCRAVHADVEDAGPSSFPTRTITTAPAGKVRRWRASASPLRTGR